MVERGSAHLGKKNVSASQKTKIHQAQTQRLEQEGISQYFCQKKEVEDKMQKLNQTLITEGFDKVRDDQVTKIHQDWEKLCKQEEIYWRQKSRVQWLKEGEQNIKFFHRSTMANRSHNRISTIKDERGHLRNAHEEIESVLV